MSHSRSKGLIRPLQSQLQGLIRAIDDLLIFASLYFSLLVYHIALGPEYLLLCIICIVLFSLFAENQEIYHGWRGAPMFDESVRILLSWLASFVLMLSGLYISKADFSFSKSWP